MASLSGLGCARPAALATLFCAVDANLATKKTTSTPHLANSRSLLLPTHRYPVQRQSHSAFRPTLSTGNNASHTTIPIPNPDTLLLATPFDPATTNPHAAQPQQHGSQRKLYFTPYVDLAAVSLSLAQSQSSLFAGIGGGRSATASRARRGLSTAHRLKSNSKGATSVKVGARVRTPGR
eukprot:2597414-Rhodomonas_salina.1